MKALRIVFKEKSNTKKTMGDQHFFGADDHDRVAKIKVKIFCSYVSGTLRGAYSVGAAR